ncbi:carboxymuconolactone decarboxylase family protein [Corynebacterium sp. ES2794-CONJ1]|uniref:carboxymuconolactone decarboxylase family protein n=1 Tax=unclassified Corynebacterium TaxID=2624378 RepID=UPI002166EB53|nr:MULTISPECIES: carboxymuconolactone decarboxylase family protein [unclassified Corynebacterium]MCS4489182.1 carboxymuconolactone decarboxylase family protein [Corynebacterium sp. ES2775-CONJ]MCS4490995.1 carboxymuconolactone decarboxylase family protein [Corynebacterium sp. ES2715-CONJ3]MCS4531124.1 carboxymuconolactone decarboxylase family protein [Corynebacterium sp. ES2730-CONJ]MCU9518491.1 carboxymuconolactone decarboxylase family protein [Corynebacterium sp. ES2794-CONJ1]
MSIDNLKTSVPQFAKDLKLNVSSLARASVLTEQQKWGTFLAAAAASRNAVVLQEIAAEAKENLSPEAYEAAFAAASIMGMNNVAYRAKGWLGDDYAQVRLGLRMNVMANPGVDKSDFELWATAVSTINGCEHCTIAHEDILRKEGLSKEQIFEAIKIAATVHGLAQAFDIDEILS